MGLGRSGEKLICLVCRNVCPHSLRRFRLAARQAPSFQKDKSFEMEGRFLGASCLSLLAALASRDEPGGPVGRPDISRLGKS